MTKVMRPRTVENDIRDALNERMLLLLTLEQVSQKSPVDGEDLAHVPEYLRYESSQSLVWYWGRVQ